MNLNLVVAVGMVLAIAVTFVVSRPARPQAIARGIERRERRLRRTPACATAADIELLLSHELPADVTHEVCRLAAEREVPPAMLWSWADAHSPTLLALALGAGYSRQELALTRPPESELDQQSLEMHAELNNCLVGSMVVRAIHPATLAEHQQHSHRQHGAPYASNLRDRTA